MNKQDQAVIVVDFQADFTEYRKGALAVPETGSDYVEQVITSTRQFKAAKLPIIATRDYHPLKHISFFTNHPGTKAFDVIRIDDREQVLWPPHCVQGTPGADILLPEELITETVSKGQRENFESYSGFRDHGNLDTGLKSILEKIGAKELIIYGLATDYCVKATVLHALEEKYKVKLLLDLCRGVSPETTNQAVEEMRAAGAEIK